MLEYLVRHWWVLTVRGALAIVFGLVAIVWPDITLVALAIVFGAYAFVDGVFAAAGAVRARPADRMPLVLEAVSGVLIGLVTLIWPDATLLVLTLLVGLWAILTGVLEIMAAVRLRREIEGEWLYVLSGAGSVLFGLIVTLWPGAGLVAVAWIIGVYAILFGALLVAISLKVRRGAERLKGSSFSGGGGPAPAPL